MPTPFLSSEEYDERAHQLYNQGQYDDALQVLREGLALYPNSVELHVGVGYAFLAREDFAWARRSFEEALVLEPEHEDALAGLGETLLKFGQRDAALQCFERVLELGYSDDVDLILQVGRSLFREDSARMPLMEHAKRFFEVAVQNFPEFAEAMASLGYAQHRLGEEDAALASLRRALQLEPDHTEARTYLANILYDRQEFEGALYHFERTSPEDHWDEHGILRYIDLRKTMHGLDDGDEQLRPWEERVGDLAVDADPLDELLAEIESQASEAESLAAANQLELFGTLLTDLIGQKDDPLVAHEVLMEDGQEFRGSWEEIVRGMRDASDAHAGRSLQEFMSSEARRAYSLTGRRLEAGDAESFVRGAATAGLLKILR